MKTAAPEKKSVKTLKGQLFGAVSMMLVAAIALGTSTYAWFINNRTVEVQNMELQVSTSTSMLVAIQKTDDSFTGYKSVITNPDITGVGAGSDMADWSKFFDNDMVPASVTTAALLTTTPTFFATNNHVTQGLLDEFEPVPAKDTTVDTVTTYGIGQGPVKKLGLRFLTSSDIDVYFAKDGLTTLANMITPKHVKTLEQINDPGNVANNGADMLVYNAEIKQAEAIRAALRVSVVAKASGFDVVNSTPKADAYASVDVKTFQFDLGAPFVPSNKNNTDYNSKNTSITIAEPNGLYAGIATLEAAPSMKIDSVDALNALVPGHATPATDANNSMGEIQADGSIRIPATNSRPLFTLSKDMARDVDVYIWLEGTDQDCLNGISGYFFNLNLPFAGADHAVPTP